MNLTIGFKTHVGRKREINEDSYAVLRNGDLLGKLDALIVVADGMGGSGGGDTASRIVAQTLPEATIEILHERYSTPDLPADPPALLRETIFRANHKVLMSRRVERPDLKLMGTTCVAAILTGDTLTVANVGDSRAYLLRNGKLSQITEDHSEVWAEVKAGRMTREEARTNRFRNQITRYVGVAGEIRPDIQAVRLRPGDTVMLCSDGLNTEIRDTDIARILACAPEAQQVCDRLVDAALRAGGRDNITVVTLRYGDFVPLVPEEEIVEEEPDTDPQQSWRQAGSHSASSEDSYDEDEEDEDQDEAPTPERRTRRRKSHSAPHRPSRRSSSTRRQVLIGLLAAVAVGEGAALYRALHPPKAILIPRPPVVRPTDIPHTYGLPEPTTKKEVQDTCLVIDSQNRPIVATVGGSLVRVLPDGGVSPLGSTFPNLPATAVAASPDSATAVGTERLPRRFRAGASTDFAIDPSGNLYQINPANNTIRIYTPGGTRIGDDIGKGSLTAPTRLAVDANGNIYVIDSRHLYRFTAQHETSPFDPDPTATKVGQP